MTTTMFMMMLMIMMVVILRTLMCTKGQQRQHIQASISAIVAQAALQEQVAQNRRQRDPIYVSLNYRAYF